LKLAEQDVSFRDIEELDMVDEPLEVESPYTTLRQYPPTSGVLPIEGKPSSVRISKTVPQFSYESGSQPDLSFIGHFDDRDRSSPDFPLPSELLGDEDTFECELKRDSDILFRILSNEETEPMTVTDNAPLVSGSFNNSAFNVNASKASENVWPAPTSSLNKKRPASPPPIQPRAKLRHSVADEAASKVIKAELLPNEEAVPGAEAKRLLPDWVAEIDQDLIVFFGDSVVYTE
jgi:hypothetical protein